MLQRNNFISCFVTSHEGAEMLVLFLDSPIARRKRHGAYIHMCGDKKRVTGIYERLNGIRHFLDCDNSLQVKTTGLKV